MLFPSHIQVWNLTERDLDNLLHLGSSANDSSETFLKMEDRSLCKACFNMAGLRVGLFKKSCTPNSRLLLHHPPSKWHLSPLEAWIYSSDGGTCIIEDSIHFLGFCNIKIMPLCNSPKCHSISSEDELFYLQKTCSILQVYQSTCSSLTRSGQSGLRHRVRIHRRNKRHKSTHILSLLLPLSRSEHSFTAILWVYNFVPVLSSKVEDISVNKINTYFTVIFQYLFLFVCYIDRQFSWYSIILRCLAYCLHKFSIVMKIISNIDILKIYTIYKM